MESKANIDWHALEAEAIRLMKSTMPELASWPIYLCDTAILPGGDKDLRNICAYTAPFMCEVVRPFVVWAGPGPTVCYSRAGLAKEAFDECHLRDLFIAAIIHETAHVARDDFLAHLATTTPSAEQVTRWREGSARFLADDSLPDVESELHLRYHDAWFVRACVHLIWRLGWLHDQWHSLRDVYSYSFPGSLDPSFYALALRDECNRCWGWAIAEVLKTDPPLRFIELWAADSHTFTLRPDDGSSITKSEN